MSDTNWISVKDRLPEGHGWYLVVNARFTLYDTTWHGGGDSIWGECDFLAPITHWQPLPEPPVAEQEADHD